MNTRKVALSNNQPSNFFQSLAGRWSTPLGKIKGMRYNYKASPRGTITTPAGGVVFIPDIAEKNGAAAMANKCGQMG